MTSALEPPVALPFPTWAGATIQFDHDPLVHRDRCKGATVNLTYAS